MSLGREIFIIFLISMFVLYFFSRLKIPTLIGYLFTGALLGPYGLKLVHSISEVEYLAEIGVILLLFTIGIEFSFKKLLQVKKALTIGGTTQILLTILVTALICLGLGFKLNQAIFIGFLVSLSSTTIILKYLQEKAEVDTHYGQTSLAILIFQDIMIVPMILIIPFLVQSSNVNMTYQNNLIQILNFIIKIFFIVALIFISTKYLVPKILYYVTKTRNQDLFLLTIIVLCFSIAILTYHSGLSLALGAFLAGLIISESEYSHQALGHILPFKNIFASFFFVSIGMLLNINFVLNQPLIILSLTLLVILVKLLIGFISGLILKLSFKSALLTGVAICSISEFSFVLSRIGLEKQIIDQNTYQIFLSVAILTMVITPFIFLMVQILLRNIAKYISFINDNEIDETLENSCNIKNQMIIIGFGITGKNLAYAAKICKIPYVICDLNSETVRREKLNGEPIIYGDATYENVLLHLNIKCAKIIVIAIPDRIAIRRIVELSRKLNPDIYIIARTRFFSEIDEIKNLGADEVIPEELETAIEIFTRVMQKYLIPKNEIEEFINKIRKDSYEMLRSSKPSNISDVTFQLPDIRITTYRVNKNSFLANLTLSELNLRQKFGLTLIAIIRQNQNIINPLASEKIYENDILVFIGDTKKLES